MGIPTSPPGDPLARHAALPPISRWKLGVIAAAVAGLAAAVVVLLWWPGTRGLSGAALVTARFDALRVGLSIGVGSGGLFALYLAWRRQSSTEADLDNRERALLHQLQVASDTKTHQERVAVASEADAAERRLNDLYIRAVEQLGSDKAPVRLGGLYALQRLGRNTPDQRETILNVVCAYLRMPFPELPDLAEDASLDEQVTHRQLVEAQSQEQQVRLTAQRIFRSHRMLADRDQFWETSTIDLSEANLAGAVLSGMDLVGAELIGTNLFGADLTASVLTGADLTTANLCAATLIRADLAQADLTSADLSQSDMSESNLPRADLTDANLSHANLTDANLTEVDMKRADVTEATMTRANMTRATVSGEAKMRAYRHGADLTGVKHLGGAGPLDL
jgi:uncharacterized protein YjbI with pentapeptide repeats